MNCENCGIAEGAYIRPGYWLRLKFRPKAYADARQVPRMVWVCGSECAVEAMFVAAVRKMVTDKSVKWQMSLQQFMSQMYGAGKLAFLSDWTAGQTSSKTPINIECAEVLREVLATTPAAQGLSGTNPCRTGGRPKVIEASKETLRKRRQRAGKHS